MKKVCALWAVMLAFLSAYALRAGDAVKPPKGTNSMSAGVIQPQPPPPPNGVDVLQYIRDYVGKFPDGSDVDDAKFDQIVGTKAADGLRKLGVTHIKSQGGVFTATLAKQHEQRLSKRADLRLGKTVSFRYSDAGGAINITEVKGVQVKVSFLLGWMDVKTVHISQDATTGNTTINVDVHVLFKTINYTVVLGPDGKVIKE